MLARWCGSALLLGSGELRHPSWLHDDGFGLLERHSAAYCVMSGAYLPCMLRATAARTRASPPGPRYAGDSGPVT